MKNVDWRMVGVIAALMGVTVSVVIIALRNGKGIPSAPPPSVAFNKRNMLQMEEAKEKNGIDATKFYNVGVVGTSGVGKSSLINGLCRWDDGDEGAVPVGIIEGPQGMKSYTLPQRPIIQLWDVPVGGTEAYPSQTFYEDRSLYAFDCLVIVTASRFTSLDMDIARRAHVDGIKVFFVRNKVQIDVEQEMRRSKIKLYNEALATMRGALDGAFQSVISELRFEQIKLYLIDTRAFVDDQLHQHDEHLLYSNIINALLVGRGGQLEEIEQRKKEEEEQQ